MIRIAISQAAFDAVAAALPLGTECFEGQPNEKGERVICLDGRFVDRLSDMHGPRESFDVILGLRLAQGLTNPQAALTNWRSGAASRFWRRACWRGRPSLVGGRP
jgi:hypothetical protein